MTIDWASLGWTEEHSRAEREEWARRIRDCPRSACRRAGKCRHVPGPGRECAGFAKHPQSKELADAVLRSLYAYIHQRNLENAARQAEEGRAADEGRARRRPRRRRNEAPHE